MPLKDVRADVHEMFLTVKHVPTDCERSSYVVYLWEKGKTQIVRDSTAGTSQMLLCNQRLSQPHKNERKLQHIMDCSHKCAYLLCSPALLCLFILRGSPPHPTHSPQPVCLINISSELLRTKVYLLKNPFKKKMEIEGERYM